MSNIRIFRAAIVGCIFSLAFSVVAAQGTLDDYRRAARIRDRFRNPAVGLVPDGVNWIAKTNAFWYRVTVPGGHRFVLIDAGRWTSEASSNRFKESPFDADRLAKALSDVLVGEDSAFKQPFEPLQLPFDFFEFVEGRKAIEMDIQEARWRCDLGEYACESIGKAKGRPDRPGQPPRGRRGRPGDEEGPSAIVAPSGETEACIRNYNVAVRPVPKADERRPAVNGPGRGRFSRPLACSDDADAVMLSRDGSEGDAYQLRSMEWSPDSKKLAVYRRQPGYDRIVHFVRSSPTDQLQPKHETTATLSDYSPIYRKPGDRLDRVQPVLFDVQGRRRILIDDALFPNPYQISRPVWRKDSHSYTFEYNQRGHQVYRVLEVDGATGQVRTVISEETQTFFAYRPAVPRLSDSGKNYRYDIDDGRQIIWMSERDGWNHLYLYDGVSGAVIRQITKGEWVVKSVDRVDEENGQIYFRALGMNPGQDPYFVHFYRIDFDGTGLVAFTQADGTHDIDWSPDQKYYIDSYSRVDLPPVVELARAADGSRMVLEKGVLDQSLDKAWRPPEVFVAKGRDGVTDIWGIVVRPFTFDPAKKYPVLEQIYAGPQGSFVPKSWGGGQGLLSTAELGFVLVQIDGMGTNNRSKAFHDVAWKNLADAGFPDRILWHTAVAAKYPWYDISRVGVYGTSAGGQNAAGAVLFRGDFYDAAFASSGCHDNRMDKIWWNEHWMGWPVGPQYEASSNIVNAHRLTGKLFLAVGELDTNVDPSSTMQLVDALIRAHKDFDLLVVPNGGHGAAGPDGRRRRNDFFVRNLLGVEPPDWNSGVILEEEEEAVRQASAGGPPYGFFDDPADTNPPYWWW